MQEFNKVNTTSNFIKNLLATTYLPLIRTVREGDYLCEDRLYIHRCEVIRCTKSGYLCSLNYKLNPSASYDRVGEYHFGERNDKLCTHYLSNSEGYDYKTHERLGHYLRCLRDMYGLNLLPLYNCFSNQPFPVHHITDKFVVKTSTDTKTKIYKIPIRFNTDYTICMDNVGITTFAPAFIRYNSLLKLNNTDLGNNIDATNRYISMHNYDVIKSKVGMSFVHPYKIRFNNHPEIKKYKNNFYTNDSKYEEIQINDDCGLNYDTLRRYFKLENKPLNLATGNHYYVTKETENSDVLKLFYATNIESVPSTATWYYLIINPKALHWYEQVDDEYVYTEDTYIDPDKTYYKSVVKRITLEDKVYTITESNCKLYDFIEDKLYLLIQVPESFDSNIVVIEGDYTNTQSNKEIIKSSYETLPDKLIDFVCTSDLKLMCMETNKITPFSDTLMEFLTWNAINNLDSINGNFDRLAVDVSQTSMIPLNLTQPNNYWYDWYRKVLNTKGKEAKKVVWDNIGYVTKDIEEILDKGL